MTETYPADPENRRLSHSIINAMPAPLFPIPVRGLRQPIEADQEDPFEGFDVVDTFRLDPSVYRASGYGQLSRCLLRRDHPGLSVTGLAEHDRNRPTGHKNLSVDLRDYLYPPLRHCPSDSAASIGSTRERRADIARIDLREHKSICAPAA